MFNFQKNDNQIHKDVTNELCWDPRVTSSHISVATKDGIVTLRGEVPNYFEKSAAEVAAQRVGGVKAVADELEVKLSDSYVRTDEDIAQAALNAFKWTVNVPRDIKIAVEKGWVTLRGEVEWDFQRLAAKNSITPLMGVRGVTNAITIRTKVLPSDVKTRIEEALVRSAEREGRKIGVSVNGDRVTLSGHVHSVSEMADARMAAWNAPGVMSVENNLTLVQ